MSSYEEKRRKAMASAKPPKKYIHCLICGMTRTDRDRFTVDMSRPAVTFRRSPGGRGSGFFVDKAMTVTFAELKERDPEYWYWLRGLVKQLAQEFDIWGA